MDLETRMDRVTRNAQEVLTPEELRELLARTDHPRAYIGFEPSGQMTLGALVTARKMRDLLEAGCELTVLLADWHAWINDKMGGDLERIGAVGRYVEATFRALGVGPERTQYRWAHDLTGRSDYWARVIRVAKASSIARTKRAMTIMGRETEEAHLDSAKLIYPSMQAADIFELPVEIAYAGMDQRRVHVLAREVAQHYDWPVPVAVHTPLLGSLRGGERMDPADPTAQGKMSKSDPGGALVLPSSPETVRTRVNGALCPPKTVAENPVVDIVRLVIFPWEGKFRVERAAKHGGALEFSSPDEFLAAWEKGTLHPLDLKSAVAAEVSRLIEPVNQYFREHPEAFAAAFGGASA
jgi:tyrosyl-tRNA synthetase